MLDKLQKQQRNSPEQIKQENIIQYKQQNPIIGIQIEKQKRFKQSPVQNNRLESNNTYQILTKKEEYIDEVNIIKQAKYNRIYGYDMRNEFEKYVILDNINNNEDKDCIKRCSYRDINSKQRTDLTNILNQNGYKQLYENPQKTEDIHNQFSNKIINYFENTLKTQIYFNQNNILQQKQHWNKHLSFPQKIYSHSTSYETLLNISMFTSIDYNLQMKAQLINLFQIDEIINSSSSWNKIVNDNALLLKLCEIVTHQNSQGKFEQFQNYLNNIASIQFTKQSGQQIKFTQDSARRKDSLSIFQHLQLLDQKTTDIINYQNINHLTKPDDNSQEDETNSEQEKFENVNKGKNKQNKKSKYHGLSRLLLYSILDLFKHQNMANLEIPIEIQDQLSVVVKRIKKSGKFSIKKNSEDLAIRVQTEREINIKTDFYNHSHYNALFLILSPITIQQLRQSYKDLQIHKYVFGIDLSNVLLEQSQIALINILKAYCYRVFSSSLCDFLSSSQISSQSSETFKEDQTLNIVNQVQKYQLYRKNSQLSTTQPINEKQIQMSFKNDENGNQKPTFKIKKDNSLFTNDIRKKYLKRVQKSIESLSQGVQVLRF